MEWGFACVRASVMSFDPLAFWTAVVACATLGTFVVLLVAAVVARRQLQETITSRHAAELAELSRRWDEPSLERSRRLTVQVGDYLREWVEFLLEEEDADDETLDILERIPNFFEDLAILEEVGAIPFEMIKKSLGGVIVTYWDTWKEATKYLRDREAYDPVYSNFERLAEKMRAALVDALP